MALDNIAVSSSASFVRSPQVFPIRTSTPADSPSSPEVADEDEDASEQQFDVPEPVTVSMEYTTKLAGKLAEKRKAVHVSKFYCRKVIKVHTDHHLSKNYILYLAPQLLIRFFFHVYTNTYYMHKYMHLHVHANTCITHSMQICNQVCINQP